MKLKKWYRSTNTSTLISKVTDLKHELNVTSQYIKNKKTLAERSSINKKFQTNQKQVFREWKNKKTEIKETPSAEEIKIFWSNIRGKIKSITKMRNGSRNWIKNTAKMLNQNRTKLL